MTAGTVMAQAAYQMSPRTVIALGLGAVIGGEMAEGDISPGPAGSASFSWLALLETERRPFVLLGISLAGTRASAISDDGMDHTLTAADVRAGVMAGKTLGAFTPYAAARGFGGPVGWTLAGEDATGEDAHHYTVGAGLTVRPGRRFDLALEVMPLGEQSATASATLAL